MIINNGVIRYVTSDANMKHRLDPLVSVMVVWGLARVLLVLVR